MHLLLVSKILLAVLNDEIVVAEVIINDWLLILSITHMKIIAAGSI